jgi:uncharacterized protein
MTIRIEQRENDCLLWIKVIPGASRSHIQGPLGDRLKMRVAAAPEAGKANAAVCELVANSIHRHPRTVEIETGHTNPEKVIRIRDMTVDQLRSLIEK